MDVFGLVKYAARTTQSDFSLYLRLDSQTRTKVRFSP